jgi:hypothetical protein
MAPQPSPTTPSAQRQPLDMAPRAPEAAHSPHYDVCHCCSSARYAASAPSDAAAAPSSAITAPPAWANGRISPMEPDLARCSALPNWSHVARPASLPAIRREEGAREEEEE